MKSHKWRDKYALPGGHIELGETIEEALRREVKEETGLYIQDPEFIRLTEFIFDEAFWKRCHFIFLDYACKTRSTNVKLSSEAEGYIWVSLNEARKLPLNPYAKRLIEKYIESRHQ